MISAQQLKELTAASQKNIDTILARIEQKLIAVAEAGEHSYACYEEAPWEALELYQTNKVSLIQQKLIDELKKHGYQAKVEKHGEPYTPRYMGMIDDEPLKQNYVLVVRW